MTKQANSHTDSDIDFDILVIGGGHAGVEAALAGSRLGQRVGLMTMDAGKLALMSCNPAIGGVGKSHIVKEIDALGGIMAKAADYAGIQFRRLNLSRGPAVWSTRVQCDRRDYNRFICEVIEQDERIEVIEALAGAFLVESGRIIGVADKDGRQYRCHSAIVCTGTFLGGLIHIGKQQTPAGRLNEKAAYRLSESLDSLGFELGRLKTGTPPRLDGATIDFSQCQIQPGDVPIPFFSFDTQATERKQIPCYLTYTTAATKELVTANLTESAMFSGEINSTGPRYCPSIEDKFYRFAHKESHQIFLEPEGNGTDDIYPNGFSTSLPESIQSQAMRTVRGLERVEFRRPGYAVEYDYCPAYQIKQTLETRRVENLYFAGQINGTSGYEEAAGQGLMAAVNATLKQRGEEPFVLDRSEAYLGVMIDDLVTRSTTEPYRMFTSRAEHRLALREDNARDRLYRYAERYGLIDERKSAELKALETDTQREIARLEKTRVSVAELGELKERLPRKDNVSLADLLRMPGLGLAEIERFDLTRNGVSQQARERAAIRIRYAGYIAKQEREIERFKKMESQAIPEGFAYDSLRGLKNEAKEKFSRFRPTSLGQAGRIEGITSGDVAVLSVALKRWNQSGN